MLQISKWKSEEKSDGGCSVDSPPDGFCLLHMEWPAQDQRDNKR